MTYNLTADRNGQPQRKETHMILKFPGISTYIVPLIVYISIGTTITCNYSNVRCEDINTQLIKTK